ncbi:MAG: T9SS type A sorting domain-containing protein, partial [Ferruginibacter sp.]
TKGKIYGLTGEAGGGSFWAPASTITSLSKGLCFQNLQAAYIAGSYFDIQDQSDLAITSTTGIFKGLLRRIGAGNDSVILSLIPIENINTAGAPITINSFANYNDTYAASVSYTLSSSITSGQRIRFAWKIETGGYAYYDTITKFFNPVTLLYDNMEGTFATNWTATISPTSTNGWNYTSSTAFEGTRSLAESPTGNYTASSTRRVTYRNTLNLTGATAAYLSFWVKHKAENCNDKLRIQVSTNGGSTYSSLCGMNTISENAGTLSSLPALTGIRENWTRELVDLSAFKGNSSVLFRFEFTSNTDASSDSYYKKLDDGFFIDNLRIIKTTAPLSSRSGEFVYADKIKGNTPHRLEMLLYPNPVTDQLNIELNVPGNDHLTFSVMDVFGRIMYSRIIEPGHSALNINSKAWASQIYFVRLLNDSNVLVAASKFVKQ